MSSPWKVKTLVEKGAPLFDFRQMTQRAGILLGPHFILLSFFITLVEKGAPLFDFRQMTRRAGILLGTHFILGEKFILVFILSGNFYFGL